MMTVSLAAVVAAGCATTRAEVPRERPALDVPIPPPRVITPLPAPEPPPVQPVGDLPGNSAPAPARPRPQKPPETAKPEVKPEEVKPPEPTPQGQTPLVPQLRTPDVGDPAQVAQQVRDAITRTRAVLEKTDYGPLSDTRKKVYDDAKLFANQAEETLKSNNLVAAKEYAEKAERLAKELQGR
jgi:hypothetical protein